MPSNGPDPAFAPLLADPRTALRPPAGGMAMAEYRRRLDLPMAAVRGPAVATVETIAIDTSVRARVYAISAEPNGTILFLHGGGFVIGSLETHDAMCRTLAVAGGARVVAVEYRLAPEHPFPAASDDCRAALRWVVGQYGKDGIALCGDSAGGHLAVGLALYAAAEDTPIAALGLLYPVVAPEGDGESWARFGTGHILTRDWMRWAWSAYLGDPDTMSSQPSLLAADLARLPPTRIIVAECDPLRDEGEALWRAIASAGGAVNLTCAPGMIHGFASLAMLTPAAGDALTELARYFCQHMR